MTDIAILTARMKAAEEAAYREFCDAYLPRLSRYLLVLAGGNEAAMRDALQATLLRVAKYIRRFDAEPAFWSWLTVVARTAWFDQRRGQRRYLAFLDRFRPHAEKFAAAAGSEESEKLEAILERHRAALPPDETEMVEWKYVEGCSVREIADRLQVSPKSVESKLVRIRAKLRKAVLAEINDRSSANEAL